jgi:heat-inducible transcriptional repressor
MDSRKELILNTIIREHVKTGAPVGSGVLVEKYKLDVSPATVRNEMSALENDGLIVQPHTSAGRVPTERAYNRFIQSLKSKKLKAIKADKLERSLKKQSEQSFKTAAKEISSLTGNAVFWAFHRHNLYYTGISNLLKQPEFSEMELIYDISSVIDQMDEIIDKVFDSSHFGVQTMIGSNNPFGSLCSTVMAKYRMGDHTGIFGILGPMRMDYEKTLAVANYVFEEIKK